VPGQRLELTSRFRIENLNPAITASDGNSITAWVVCQSLDPMTLAT
jgi:hypothetical protein